MYHPRCVETIGCWIPLTLHATIVDDTRLLELALRKLLTTNAKPFFLNVLNNFQGRIAEKTRSWVLLFLSILLARGFFSRVDLPAYGIWVCTV